MNSAEILSLKLRAGIQPFTKRLPALTRTGSEWTCPCPWDSHKNAVFAVYPAKDDPQVYLFSCYACDKHGDVLTFIRLKERVSFPEALKALQQELGDEAKEPEAKSKFEFDQEKAAARLPELAEYLRSRGISEDVAREAGLGVVYYPGVGPMVSMPYGVNDPDSGRPVVKFRWLKFDEEFAKATNEDEKKEVRSKKFRHVPGAPSDDVFYGLETLDGFEFLANPDLWIVESELDALTLRSHGFNAGSVSSATSSLDKGELKYPDSVIQKLIDSAERIFVSTDMDKSGENNWLGWAKKLPSYKTFRIRWNYKEKDDPKDIGDLYKKDPVHFRERLEELKTEALNRPPVWREKFHTVAELAQGEVRFIIKRIMPEGVNFLGSLSGVGKTLFALSLARAITTGERFLGIWEVPERMNVMYLCPEMGDRAIRRRAEKFGIPINERFFCQTMKDGVTSLADPMLAMAIRDLKPVLFLDTAIRFSHSPDENSASANAQGLGLAIFSLLNMGAPVVDALHHAPKAAANQQEMTLENVLRGTGDVGAVADSVWGLQRDRGNFESRGDLTEEEYMEESATLTRLFVKCVKPRDFEPVGPFRIQGRPFIDERGDFVVLTENVRHGYTEKRAELDKLLTNDPKTSKEKAAGVLHMRRNRVEQVAGEVGWIWQGKKDGWTKKKSTERQADGQPVLIPLCSQED